MARRSLYEEYKEKHQREGTKFVDHDFPANYQSIDDRRVGNVDWKRISEMYPNAKFFSDGASPEDIIQGKEALDCYFLSAVAALAEFPALLQSIFGSKTISEQGIYMASLVHNGKVE